MRTRNLEICGDSFVLQNTRNGPRNPKKRVGRYCGTYTGKDTEIPIFTLHLSHSETSGVAVAGKRRLLAVNLPMGSLRVFLVSGTVTPIKVTMEYPSDSGISNGILISMIC